MNRRHFIKTCGAIVIIPALSTVDDVINAFTDEEMFGGVPVSFGEFSEQLLRNISASIGVPYDILAGNYNSVEYCRKLHGA